MNKLKGLEDIPSTMSPRRLRRSLTEPDHEHEIFSEMARLSREKLWLSRERQSWQERIERIDARLKEVAKLEESLQQQMVKKSPTFCDTKQTAKNDNSKHEVIVKY